ncbi:hypothetical protein J7E97_10625 [Streptomyces sp. ISL-66]|uniref:hypothetical protein n=1 Tax=Streptomyces sp. ISL-66 TaxID=2819186 RepID=UPI001BE75F7F|nr:hypothetical protein [Streptomyces sp. ISL-66]MBT2468319.1 hypothetical protein [Streptomyces sp. ISL-66]
MSDAATSESTDPDADQLGALCRKLAEAADAVGEAAGYASRLALGSRLPFTALGFGSRRRAAWRTLLRALTDPAGLGWAPRGRGVARAGWLAGVFAGRENLAVSLAVCGLKGRIRVANTCNPGLKEDPDAAVVLRAVEDDRQADAVREFRDLVRRQGAGPAFALLNPSFADILAWNALTDDNPFNDHAGWQVATGRAMAAEPLLGLGAAFLAFFDRGPACAEPETGLLAEPDTTGTPAGYLRNAGLIATAGGAVLLQLVTGADGTERCVVQLAGPPRDPGRVEASHEAHDAYDADEAYEPYVVYVRTVAATVRRLVPSGTELALVGRGPGALAAERLSLSREFTTVYPAARLCCHPESEPDLAALAAFRGRVTATHLTGVPGRPDVLLPGRAL